MAWLDEARKKKLATGEVGKTSLSVSKIIQRSLFVDDTDSRLLSPDYYTLDVVGCLAHFFQLRVDGVGRFNSSLCMEFRGVRDLEENIFHDVRAIRALELEGFT